MKIIYYLFIINILMACNLGTGLKKGDGNVTTEEFEVEEFEKIVIGGNYDVKLYPSDYPKVVVEVDQNLIKYIQVDVLEGKELSISSIYGLNPSDGVVVEIYYDKLRNITSTGASKIVHEKPLESENLNIDVSGAGAIDLNLRVKNLNLNFAGAGLIKLIGYAERQKIQLSGAGALEAESLESDYCEVFISGFGSAKVNATKQLDANISGMGNVEYFGNPETIHKNVSGIGKVKKGTEYIEEKEEI